MRSVFILIYLMFLFQLYEQANHLFWPILILNLIFLFFIIRNSISDSKEIDSLQSELRKKTDLLKEKDKHIKDLEDQLSRPNSPSPSSPVSKKSSTVFIDHHRTRSTLSTSQRSLTHSWFNISSTTEARACNPCNVDWPIPTRDNGVYRFKSLNSSASYRTTLANCSCQAYKFNESRPCKHMVRLGICLGYYTRARHPENQAALSECIEEYQVHRLES